MQRHVDAMLAHSPHTCWQGHPGPCPPRSGSEPEGSQRQSGLQRILDHLPSAPQVPFRRGASVSAATLPQHRSGEEVSTHSSSIEAVPRSRHWRCIATLMKEPLWQQTAMPPRRPLKGVAAGKAGQDSGTERAWSANAGNRPLCSHVEEHSALALLPEPLTWTLSLPEHTSVRDPQPLSD